MHIEVAKKKEQIGSIASEIQVRIYAIVTVWTDGQSNANGCISIRM